MKIRNLPTVLALHTILFATSLAVLYKAPTQVLSAAASHLVISEVQVAGASADEDFIELYNPTSVDISLDGLRLVKRSSSGVTNTSIVVFASDATVSAHGYYLWCNSDLSSALGCNASTSATVSNNNSVAVVNGTLNEGVLVDAVTFGAPANPLGEGTSLAAPDASTSAERKANSTSDETSMGSGGSDEFAGNGEDTDNNSTDFVGRTVPQPQNSQSAVEPALSPSPTPEPSPSPTPEASPSPVVSPSPTVEPSPTPEASPSPTPETSPSPTPETTPSPTPAASPSPTPETSPSPDISPTPTPTPSPSPSPSPGKPPFFSGFLFTCSVRQVPIRFGRFTFNLPFFRCTFK